MTDYSSHFDIAYADATHPRQSLDLFIPASASASSKLLVWVHGQPSLALRVQSIELTLCTDDPWRQAAPGEADVPTEAKEDFTKSLVPKVLKLTNLPLAVVEYRLTPEVAHPAHVNDVISGLSLLTSSSLLECENGSPKWNRNDLALAGHSVGAFLCCQLTLRPPASLKSFSVPDRVRRAISSIVVIAGIYDLEDMLVEYPDYASWTDEAIGLDPETLRNESVSNWSLYEDEAGKNLRIFLVSGKEDELVSEQQADLMVKCFKRMLGSDDEAQRRFKVDYDTVKGTHDSMLHMDEIPRIWAEFVEE